MGWGGLGGASGLRSARKLADGRRPGGSDVRVRVPGPTFAPTWHNCTATQPYSGSQASTVSTTLVPPGFHHPFVGLSVSHKTETDDLNSPCKAVTVPVTTVDLTEPGLGVAPVPVGAVCGCTHCTRSHTGRACAKGGLCWPVFATVRVVGAVRLTRSGLVHACVSPGPWSASAITEQMQN